MDRREPSLNTAIAILLLLALAFAIFRARKPSEGHSIRPHSRDLSMLPAEFIVFDLETTGLNPEVHEIIEIGAIKVRRDFDEHETFSTLVHPQGRISARITTLTGIDRAMIKADGLPLTEALQAFRDFVGDLHVVSFNTAFDLPFLSSACKRADVDSFNNSSSCALKMARAAWPGRSSYKLTHICEDAGIAITSEHRALPDCERALRVYVAAAQKLRRR